MKPILTLFSKPFPQEESFVQSLQIIAAVSIFIFVFLYVFQPFGIHLLESNRLTICLGFAAVTFATSLVYELFVTKVLRIKGSESIFTFGKWILYFFSLILLISFTNFLFIRLYLFDGINWQLFPAMLRGTALVGIFPIIGLGVLALFRSERKYQRIASEMQHQLTKKKPAGANQLFDIALDDIRFIEAMQNYINVGYINESGDFESKLERATMKSLSTSTLSPSIIQCHRSYFVNKNAVEAIKGNAQGLQLTLNNCDKKIPVSRSFVAAIRD